MEVKPDGSFKTVRVNNIEDVSRKQLACDWVGEKGWMKKI